jgi:hypothetical protein
MYAAIIAGFGVVITELAGVTDYSARFYSWLSGSGSKASFAFDATTGNIVVIGSANSTVKLNSSSHFGIEGIQMVIAGSEVTYKINGTPLNAVSYIEGKPVHTALVMAYLVKDKHYNRFAPQSSAPKSDAGYVYTIEDDGSVRLFEKTPNGTAGAEVASINTAIRKQLDGNDAGSKEARKQACEKTFGVGVSDSVCSAHFYNILGKSGLGMLENMATAAKGKQSVEEALISAPANIKYEILKNLDWKMRVANGKKEMASVDQWVERLEQDARPAMKELAGKYRAYFKDNSNVKNILDKMVMDINNNTRLLDEKYKEAVQTPQPPVRRRRARLSAAQVADLRSQVLTQNVALNAPMALPGYPGVNLIELGPFQMGGASNQYEQHFENIKQSLAGFNQKLSSDTDRKIKAKISEIGELNAQLESIHKKINEYTKILRTEKYPTGISRTITLSDVENLVNQYKAGTQEQTKQIVTLSTAFGKIKMLLEKQEANAKPAEKNFLFDL